MAKLQNFMGVSAAICLFLALLDPLAARAQNSTYASTVAACGTPNNSPVVGNPYPLTQDTTGRLCNTGPATTPAGTSATTAQPVQGVTGGVPIPISGSISASFSQFAPISPSITLTATSASSNALLTGGGTTLSIYNGGTTTAYGALGASSAVTASATSPIVIPAGSTVGVGLGSNTYLAVYAASGSDTIIATSGAGGVGGYGGGGSGGGGGGAITAASGSYASGALSAGSVVDIGTGASPAANTVNSRLATINTTLGSPFQAGGSIGAGSAIIGKIGIDQTTPGTTNGVQTLSGSVTNATIQQGGSPLSSTNLLPTGPDGVADGPVIAITNGNANGTVIPSTLTQGFNSINIALTASATGESLSIQQSFDQTNWITTSWYDPIYNYSTNFSSAGHFASAQILAPYFRVQQTGLTSGTTAGYVQLKRQGFSYSYAVSQLGLNVYPAVKNGTGSTQYAVTYAGTPISLEGYTSTSTALGASSTYTGTSIDMGVDFGGTFQSGYAAQGFYVYTDQLGTAYMDTSTDGSTWRQMSAVSVQPNTPTTIHQPITARYFRVRFINGSTAQTTFYMTPLAFVSAPYDPPSLGYTDSTTALGASATFNGFAHPLIALANYFQCRAYSDQTGTLNVLESDDSGSNFYPAASATVTAAGTMALARVNITGQSTGATQYKCQVVNGSTAETTLRLTSSFTAN